MFKSSLSKTIVASLFNFLAAGAIVAGASGLSLWKDYLNLDESQISWLNVVSANCFGAAVGALFGGVLADKFGRKNVFTYNLLLYIFGVMLIVTGVTFLQLAVGFILVGISVGAGIPASWTYITEISEPDNRGRNILISQLFWGIGAAAAAGFSTIWAPGNYGFGFVQGVADFFGVFENHTKQLNVFTSRCVFMLLQVLAAGVWLLQRQLQNSEEWIEKKSTEAPMSIVQTFTEFFKNKTTFKTICFLVGLYACWNCVASVMGFFLPKMLQDVGLPPTWAARISFNMWVVTDVLTLIGIFVLEKFRRRTLFTFGCICSILAWAIVLMGIDSIAVVMAFVILWSLQAGISIQFFYALWSTELFPTRYRCTAQGFTYFLVRSVCAIWGVVMVDIYAEGAGFTVAAIIMLIFVICAAIIGLFGAPKTHHCTLDEIHKIHYGE